MKKYNMTVKEMYSWLEARGCVLRKGHTKKQLKSFIDYYCKMREETNPTE